MPGTVRLRNTNPLGQVDLPLLRRVLEPGEEFDCPAEHAKALLKQTGNYELVEDKKPATRASARKKGDA